MLWGCWQFHDITGIWRYFSALALSESQNCGLILGVISGQETVMCGSGKTAHDASTWGQLSFAPSCFPNDFPLGLTYFLSPRLYMCGLQQRTWRENGTIWKGSPSKSKHRPSQNFLELYHLGWWAPRSRKGCRECPVGRPGIRVMASLLLGQGIHSSAI